MKLHYIEKGSGFPLVLLHGNGENAECFCSQMKYFSRYFRVIAVDTRGHGKSPRGTKPFTIRQFAEDLHMFFMEHHIERAHILGFSDGGNIAMIFAMRYPEMVERLVLNGANLTVDGLKTEVQYEIEREYEEALMRAAEDEEAQAKAELYALMIHDPNLAVSELAAITTKTLVIAGTQDMIKESHTRLIYEHLPDAELAFIEGDHFIAYDEPEAFNGAVGEFLMKGTGYHE